MNFEKDFFEISKKKLWNQNSFKSEKTLKLSKFCEVF